MPDEPKPHLDENGFVILDEPEPEPEPSTAHLAAEAVVACGMCDDDGYRGGVPCDHVDRSETAARGAAAVRAALAKGRES